MKQPAAEEPEEETLLAAPGKRDDQRYRGKRGPKKRHARSKARGVEINTPRTNNPGAVGYETLHHLSSIGDEFRKAGLYHENIINDDNLEERQLFEVKQEIRELIKELDGSKLGIINEENKTQ